MKGLQIFTHSVRLVFNNLGAALRVSLVLYLVQVAQLVYLFFNPLTYDIDPETMAMPDFDGGVATTSAFLGLAGLVASLWIAVAWHRFVLKEEYPEGWVPRWHGAHMLGYLGRSILIALLIVLALIVVSAPVGLIAAGLPGVTLLLPAAIVGVGAFLFFRLCVMLPAAALGQKITLSEAWNATKDEGSTAAILALIVIGASLIVQLPSLANQNPDSIINLVYGIVVNWFATIIGISVLTTIYGHYIEGRAID